MIILFTNDFAVISFMKLLQNFEKISDFLEKDLKKLKDG